MKLLTALVTIVLLTVALPTQAQEKKPSLEETMDFISGKLRAAFSFPAEYNEFNKFNGYTSFDFNGCEVRWVFSGERREMKKSPWLTYTDEYKTDLSKFDPTKVELSEVRLENRAISLILYLNAYNDKKVVTFTRTFQKSQDKVTKQQHGAVLPLPFDRRDFAERMVKAFTYAIELCGGKKEPF